MKAEEQSGRSNGTVGAMKKRRLSRNPEKFVTLTEGKGTVNN